MESAAADWIDTGRSWLARRAANGNLEDVSQAERIAAEKVLQDLPSDDRAWLEEQLDTYRELLAYLHEH